MTIKKAIDVLTTWSKENCPPRLADEFNALNLALEVLTIIEHLKELLERK